MDKQTRDLLDGIFVYAEILNNMNIKLQELISNNTSNKMHENERLFYEISSELMRVFPVRTYKDFRLDVKSGIFLLKEHIPFLLGEFDRLFNQQKYKEILKSISVTRNKFIHEPHNIKAVCYVGEANSCIIGLRYKEHTQMISTVEIAYIIWDLNIIFNKLKEFYIEIVSRYDAEYQEYPCYKTMQTFDFEKHNKKYPRINILKG